MKTTAGNLRTYAGFARRFGRRFVEERLRERRGGVAPAPHRPRPAEWRDDRLTVAWLGHATTLINFYGTWLVTDPALRERVGVRVPGLLTVGPRRLVQPALAARELPALDAVLVSHAHMDHCDKGTLARLPRRLRAVVQRGNGDLVRRFRRVDELTWGESVEVDGARIESIEVSHWGARKLTDSHRGYGGFLIEKNGRAIVFGGDTADTRAFARLRERARVVLAMMPIGAYDPYIHAHANPEQSWRMAREMGATYLLPMHHSTFRLSREPVGEPVERLLAVAGRERWRVALTEVGQTWTLPED
ncbi:MAG TPA: MBL fold metallo-hydrolase [Pyrinomonadaceae bacterium]|nr:MBL fold metallo-hydrolase [Pyrinomonadaceae bacterium]